MDIKQKLALETQDSDKIYLYREGLFWKAYERSAIQFAQTIAPYQLNRNYSKALTMDVISLGFPDLVLSRILEGRVYEMLTEKQIMIASTALDEVAFHRAKKNVLTKTAKEAAGATNREKQIVEQLRLYDIGVVTPIDCMNFLSSLKKQLESVCENK